MDRKEQLKRFLSGFEDESDIKAVFMLLYDADALDDETIDKITDEIWKVSKSLSDEKNTERFESMKTHLIHLKSIELKERKLEIQTWFPALDNDIFNL